MDIILKFANGFSGSRFSRTSCWFSWCRGCSLPVNCCFQVSFFHILHVGCFLINFIINCLSRFTIILHCPRKEWVEYILEIHINNKIIVVRLPPIFFYVNVYTGNIVWWTFFQVKRLKGVQTKYTTFCYFKRLEFFTWN